MNTLISANFNIMEVACPVCGTMFTKKTKNHTFDKRKCFKIAYNRKLKEEATSSKCPSFICPECGKMTKLEFTPKKNIKKWSDFLCPFCGYKNNIRF